MNIFLLCVLAFVQASIAQNSCNYQNQGYNINWNLDVNQNVNFNLTYSNFPQTGDYWIAFGYSQTNLILINTLNGQAELTTANLVNSQPIKTVGSNILQTQSVFLNNGNLEASFAIPLSALMLSSNNGQGCMTWLFYFTPTQNGTAYSGSPTTQQVCNIQQTCNEDGGQLNAVTGNTGGATTTGQSSVTTRSPYQPQYYPNNQYNQQQPQQQPQYSPQNGGYGQQQQQNQYSQNRIGQQQQGQLNGPQYNPSNPNIQYYPYTYNQGFSGNYDGNQIQPQYDSPPASPVTSADQDFVIENPNYQFLPPQLNQEFRDSVNSNRNGLLRDQSGNSISTTTQAPVLSNEEQNRLNYQRIQQNPPTTLNPSVYTNNIYGYDYRSNPNMQYTVNGNPQQYQPPAVRKFPAPANSPFALRKKRQTFTPVSGQSLSGTAYQGQDQHFVRTNNAVFNDPVLTASYTGSPSSYTGATIAPPSAYVNNNNNNVNNNYNSQQRSFDQQALQLNSNTPLSNVYYPYLQPVVNPNSPNFQQVAQQDAAAQLAYQDPNCTGGSDPYWCANYVQNFLLGQNQYASNNFNTNNMSQQPSQGACSALQDSLRNAYHRCCQTVGAAGC